MKENEIIGDREVLDNIKNLLFISAVYLELGGFGKNNKPLFGLRSDKPESIIESIVGNLRFEL